MKYHTLERAHLCERTHIDFIWAGRIRDSHVFAYELWSDQSQAWDFFEPNASVQRSIDFSAYDWLDYHLILRTYFSYYTLSVLGMPRRFNTSETTERASLCSSHLFARYDWKLTILSLHRLEGIVINLFLKTVRYQLCATLGA